MPLHDVSAGETIESTVRLTGGNITTSSHTFTDATGLTLTVVTGSRKCLVIFTAFGACNTINQDVNFDIAIDGTRQGGTSGLVAQGGAQDENLSFSYLTDVLSAGSHTFKIQWYTTGSASGTIFASGTAPAILSVIELS